jgi:glycosyltransferase involved in cell wall biosynthesis
MHILYLTQWFDPEPGVVKGPGFARALIAAGHDVTVVTGLPNYPGGRIYPGYRLRPIQHETIDGVRVVRLPLYPSHNRSSLGRSLNFLSFFVSALVYCLLRRERCDLVYAYHPPITVGLAAALAGWVRRLRLVVDIQDLWPDTIAATGMRGAPWLVPIVARLCTFVYRRATAIIVQSEGMRDALIARGVPPAKLRVIRNWAPIDTAPPPVPTARRTPFTLVYGGNFGPAQALATVIDAAAILERTRGDIAIELYGSGIEDAALKAHAKRLGLRSVRFHDRISQQAITAVYATADALLLHLADDPLFAITIPSKTQVYLAMGRPIVAGIAGEGAALLHQSSAAHVVPPSDPAALAGAIGALADMPVHQREAMGARGRVYYRDAFSFEAGIARTLAVLEGTNERRQQQIEPAPP